MDSVCFVLHNDFYIIPHNLLLSKPKNFVLSFGYVYYSISCHFCMSRMVYFLYMLKEFHHFF